MGTVVKRKRRPATRLSGKHQVTIPLAVVEAAHLAVGDTFRVEADGDGRVVLIRESDPLDAFVGAFPGIVEATDLEGLRGEWER
jgi:bifunctional DNA-binding transcriptional regulator/antitoxin component of YhaV-PrlF toxin-antitoxin module